MAMTHVCITERVIFDKHAVVHPVNPFLFGKFSVQVVNPKRVPFFQQDHWTTGLQLAT